MHEVLHKHRRRGLALVSLGTGGVYGAGRTRLARASGRGAAVAVTVRERWGRSQGGDGQDGGSREDGRVELHHARAPQDPRRQGLVLTRLAAQGRERVVEVSSACIIVSSSKSVIIP